MEQVSPIAAVRRHKSVSALLVVLCTLAALGLSLVGRTVYTAEARLAVGGGAGLSAEAVPGFALATQQLAANYSRYINNAQSQSGLASQLGLRPGDVESVSASPIPESSVIRIEVQGQNSTATQRAVSAVASSLMEQVNNTAAIESKAAQTLTQYTNISAQVAQAQQALNDAKAAAAGGSNSQAVSDATVRLATLQVQQDALGQKYRNQVAQGSQGAANLIIVEKPTLTGDNRLPRLEQFGLAGAVGGLVLAVLLSLLLERPRTGSRRARGGDVSVMGDRPPIAVQARPDGARSLVSEPLH